MLKCHRSAILETVTCYLYRLPTITILSFRTAMPWQTVQTDWTTPLDAVLMRVFTICYSICIFWRCYSMVESLSWSLCTYQYFLPEEGWDSHGDNFEKLGSYSPSMGKYVVSKIPWAGHQLPEKVSNFAPPCLGVLSNSQDLGLFCCLIPPVSPRLPPWGKY